jgi:hypothetical protein
MSYGWLQVKCRRCETEASIPLEHVRRPRDRPRAIKKIIDPAAPPEERPQRGRRLTKGRQSFVRLALINRRRRGNDARLIC